MLVKPTEPGSKMPSGFEEEVEDYILVSSCGRQGSPSNSSLVNALFLTTTGEEKVAVIT